ncbi:hypothetical protein Y032_0086g1996 [Ancylostoma ceylanicum]|uniref:Nanos-type domain-containing protein n=1 Tax=Ancylostoma ceylanicum TaxID=53326 RepID=A0A016TQR6_9BILA|nr:hypothetical protein Y032_0086g1996 [Ancylostoma ceylanicum]
MHPSMFPQNDDPHSTLSGTAIDAYTYSEITHKRIAVRTQRTTAPIEEDFHQQPPSQLQRRPALPLEQAKNAQRKVASVTKCKFCEGLHWTTDCTLFATLTARRDRVYYLRKCERCLTPNNHLVTACPAKIICFYCKRANRTAEMTKHHSAFCVYQFKM